MYHLQCTSLRFILYQVNNDSGHAFMVIGEENIVMTCYATRDQEYLYISTTVMGSSFVIGVMRKEMSSGFAFMSLDQHLKNAEQPLLHLSLLDVF